MIGKITHPSGWEATLTDDLVWESNSPKIADMLNRSYSPQEWRPSMGARGYFHLHKAAEELGATVTDLATPPPLEPGARY